MMQSDKGVKTSKLKFSRIRSVFMTSCRNVSTFINKKS